MIPRSAALVLCLLLAARLTWAEELVLPNGEDDPLVFKIVSKVLGPKDRVLWEQNVEKPTNSGHPVVFKMGGENFRLKTTLTAFRKEATQFLLVVKGEVWLESGENARSVQNTLQSVACELGEKVAFFPMGMREDAEDVHVVLLEITIENPLPEKNDF